MENTFVKPDLILPQSPFINRYIVADYQKVNTLEDFNNFITNGLNTIETTKNEVKRNAWQIAVFSLYSMVTGVSYQTKKFQFSN